MIVVKPIDKRIDEVTKNEIYEFTSQVCISRKKKNKIKDVHLLKMNLLVQNCWEI